MHTSKGDVFGAQSRANVRTSGWAGESVQATAMETTRVQHKDKVREFGLVIPSERECE